MRGRREREPAKTSNLILALLGLFLLTFISAMTAIFCVKGAVPDRKQPRRILHPGPGGGHDVAGGEE